MKFSEEHKAKIAEALKGHSVSVETRRKLSESHKLLPKISLVERFWSNVRKTPTCHIWTGLRTNYGYGRIRIEGKNIKAHRLAWTLFRGPIPEGLWVCHTCDNPPCVNIEHLFLGTAKENSRDSSRKHRLHFGESNGFHKLSESQVSEILRRYQKGIPGPGRNQPNSASGLAREFHVGVSTIHNIVNHKSWN